MSFKFVGGNHYSFVPEGETKPRKGYNLHFTDDEQNPDQISVGEVPFKCGFTEDTAQTILGLAKPEDLLKLSQFVGKSCELTFNRKGKITGVQFPVNK